MLDAWPRAQVSVTPGSEWLADHAWNAYSQFGEDGILQAIFDRVGVKNRWCFECGASCGVFMSNTRRLIEAGWQGVLVESDPKSFSRLSQRNNCQSVLWNVQLQPTGENSADALLSKSNAPTDLDLFCIDIDGADYHIWNCLTQYLPRVVVIEVATDGDPHFDDPDYIPAIGEAGQAGIGAISKLAAAKGYGVPIVTYSNAICLRYDLI